MTLPYLALGRHGVRSGVELLLVVRGGLLDQQPGVRDRFSPFPIIYSSIVTVIFAFT